MHSIFCRAPSFPLTGVYNPKAFILHAALLRQACAHCAKFPTAASRRSLARVSVPVWLIILSDQLPIVALVGHYPTNKLMGRKLIPHHEHGSEARFPPAAYTSGTLSSLSPPFGGLSWSAGQITYVLRTRAPLYSGTAVPFLVRLACVKYAASVRSEPGSNSPYKLPARCKLLPSLRISALSSHLAGTNHYYDCQRTCCEGEGQCSESFFYCQWGCAKKLRLLAIA